MRNSTFTIDQISNLRKIEKALMRAGGVGLRAEVQGLIRRLISGGVGSKSDDPREAQANILWDKGFGRELHLNSFEAYLATIPEVPEDLLAKAKCFPLLVLVDVRTGLLDVCDLLKVDFSGDDLTFEDFDPNGRGFDEVYWILAQDGRKNDGKSVRACRQQFANDEVGLTDYEGLALFAQNPEGFRNRAMNLPGSVRYENRGCAAYLRWFNERPELSSDSDDNSSPHYGSGSRRA